MKEKKQNEELQSRREFFKEAAKKALPIFGTIALASSPIIAQVAGSQSMGCSSDGCSYTCATSCYESCKGACKGCTGCKDSCQGYCKYGCYTTNKN